MLTGELDLAVKVYDCGYVLHLDEARTADASSDRRSRWSIVDAVSADLGRLPADDPQELKRRFATHTVRPDAVDPALFRQFVEIDCFDVAAIVHFHNRYGTLEGHLSTNLATWSAEARLMRDVILAHQLIDDRDEQSLGEFVRWGTGTTRVSEWSFSAPPEPRYAKLDPSSPLAADPVLCRIVQGRERTTIRSAGASPDQSPLAVAEAWLGRTITEHLQIDAEVIRFGPDPRTGRWMLRFAPSNLLFLMWLQLVRMLAGERRHERCRACGTWFEAPPKAGKQKEFCSDLCKFRDYRTRKRRAVELRGKGRTLRQVAAETRTDVETVKKWIGVKGKGKGDK
jgi:hypothetical protein